MRRLSIAALGAVVALTAACGSDKAAEPAATTSAPATEAPAPTTAAPTPATEAPAATDAATPATEAPAATDAATPAKPKIAANAAASECAAEATLSAGKLVIGTGNPAFPPYVLDDKPESGEGFEAAVAYAVAATMGFGDDAVSWVRTDFDPTIAPGPKDFDFNLQQFTINDERKQVVDFSDGYYTAAQAVFGYADSAAANAKSVADLKALKIGVAASTTSIGYVTDVIKPDSAPLIFDDNAAAKAALDSKAIDAIVSDLPTALFITAVEIEGTKVFGQIEGSGTDQFGLLLAKGSKLTPCVNLALAELKSSGTLAAITTQWMSDWAEAPVIGA